MIMISVHKILQHVAPLLSNDLEIGNYVKAIQKVAGSIPDEVNF
jgi:hypothetical protein